MLVQLIEGNPIDVYATVSSFKETPCRADILYDVVTNCGQKLTVVFGQASAVIHFGYGNRDKVELAERGLRHRTITYGRMMSEDDAPAVASALNRDIRCKDSEQCHHASILKSRGQSATISHVSGGSQ